MLTHDVRSSPGSGIAATAHHDAIAVVEDPFVQNYLRDLLVREGYQVIRTDASGAIKDLQSDDEQIDLVITNSPAEFLVCANWVRILYTASYPDTELASRFSFCRVLPKPFHPAELLSAVRELTGSV